MRSSPREAPVALAAAGALAGIVWNASPFPGPAGLTVGRVVLLVNLAASLALMLGDRRLPRFSRPAWACVACLSLAAALVLASALTRGCFCDGAASGFLEFTGVVVITAVAVTLAPARAPLLGACVVGGAVLIGVAALAGAGEGGPGGERLGGTLGNPNGLGLYVALVMPGLVAALWRGGRWRWSAVAAAVPLLSALALTYSRGALLGFAAGSTVAVAAFLPPTRRARVAFACGYLLVLALVLATYPSFNAKRTVADTRDVAREAAAVDRGGLDARAQGPIPAGPSQLVNPSPGVLEIRTAAAGEGVSVPLSPAPGGVYRAAFEAWSPRGRVPLFYALADNFVLGASVRREAILRPAESRYNLRWLIGRRVENPRLYLWTSSPRAVFRLTAVRVALAPLRPADTRPLDLRLLGLRPGADPAGLERRFVQSRVDVAKEALRLLRSEPLLGIGWQRFPEVSLATLGPDAAHATHNEPLRFGAELGIPGLLLLLGFLGALLVSAWRLGGRFERSALLGTAATGIVGILFANGLASPATSLPFAVAAGMTVGLSVVAPPAARGTADRAPRQAAPA